MLLKKPDPADSAFLRGIAILVIMLHNYFHVLTNAPGENEFGFSIGTTWTFLNNLRVTPSDAVKQLFSFFGHYGVQIFVFMSGYGLAMKYAASDQIKYKAFLVARVKKIYPVLFFAVLFLFLYKAAVTLAFPSKEIDLSSFVREALLKLTLVSNLVPGEAQSISGPWWFFSLIFQLYLVAPFLLRSQNNKLLLFIIIASWAFQIVLLAFRPDQTEYIRVNLPGHLPEFCLGIYFARAGAIRVKAVFLFVVAAIFILGSFDPYVWVVSFLCVPVLAVALYSYTSPSGGSTFRRVILFFGENSLYFFAVHGLCRAPFVEQGNKSVTWSVLAAVAFLFVVTVLTMLFKYLTTTIQRLFSAGWRSNAFKR